MLMLPDYHCRRAWLRSFWLVQSGLVGLVWGFVDGFVVGLILSLVYNCFAKEKTAARPKLPRRLPAKDPPQACAQSSITTMSRRAAMSPIAFMSQARP